VGTTKKKPKTNKRKFAMQNRHWFLAQTFLLLLILFSPFNIKVHLPTSIRYLGSTILGIGGVFALAATLTLKRNLKPSLKPRAVGYLVTTGLYRIVRHPAYSCILIAALGWGFWLQDIIRIVLTLALFVFFDAKSRVEEEWLEKTYPEYTDYKKRVPKKFIPWLY